MANDKDELKPDDFPIKTEQEKLKTESGKPVGTAASGRLAEDIADRLNEHADREEQDRWSA